MSRRPQMLAIVTVLGLFVVSEGCAPPAAPTKAKSSAASSGTTATAGHSHADAPKTLSAAVSKIAEMTAAIKSAFAENAPDKAHGPLHEMDELLEGVAVLASKETLAPDKLPAITTAVKTLTEQFKKVDDKMHGKDGADFTEVSGKIDEALKSLQEALPSAQ